MTEIPLLGEAASLAAAACWAVAVTLFRRPVEEHGAWTVNLAKSSIAAALLGLTVIAAGELGALLAAPGGSVAVIALSGVLGLTVGDTALFAAVGRLGVHRTLLFQTLGPVFTAVLAIGFYGEPLRLDRLAGIAVVLAGLVLVIAPARPTASAGTRSATPARFDLAGHALAVLAAAGQGAGIVLAKDGMADVPLIAASFVRLLASVLGLLVVMHWSGRLRAAVRALATRRALRRLTPPTLLGTYVAFLLMMAGVAWAPASVASVLLATSPIFSFFLDRWTVGAPLTARGLGGTLIAVAGVGVLAVAGG